MHRESKIIGNCIAHHVRHSLYTSQTCCTATQPNWRICRCQVNNEFRPPTSGQQHSMRYGTNVQHQSCCSVQQYMYYQCAVIVKQGGPPPSTSGNTELWPSIWGIRASLYWVPYKIIQCDLLHELNKKMYCAQIQFRLKNMLTTA